MIKKDWQFLASFSVMFIITRTIARKTYARQV